MKPAIRFVARLYPANWRDRYGREFNALLDDVDPRFRDLLDVLRRALEMRVAVWSFRKIVVACGMAGALLGAALAFTMPDVYISIAAIRVHAAQPPARGQSTVGKLLDVAQEKASTRDALVGLIERNHLYERERATNSIDYALERLEQTIIDWTVPGKEFNKKPDSIVIAFLYEDAARAQQTLRDYITVMMAELTPQKVKASSAMTPVSPMTALPAFEAIDPPPAVPLAVELVRSFSNPKVYGSIWGLLAEIELKYRAVPVFFGCGAGLMLGALFAGLRGWIRQVRGRQQLFTNARETWKMLPHLRPSSWPEMLLQDVRFALRSFRRSPFLACTTVLTLALGIGLNTGVFTVINAVLFRARVDKDPDSFVRLYAQNASPSVPQGQLGGMSLADYHAYRAAQSLSDLAAWHQIEATLGGEISGDVRALLVSCNFFSVYGLDRPKLGRLFLVDECSQSGAGPVAVLGEEIWRNRFAADPQILGRVISLNRHAFTVIGVAPALFSGGINRAKIWVPYTMQSQLIPGGDLFEQTGTQWLITEGRLKPGYSRSAAQAELNVIARQQDRFQPGRRTALTLTNGSMMEEPGLREQSILAVSLWMGALMLLLLIACANVTTLLLSRAAARQREVAIRLSLGASRTRLLCMLLTESLILAATAGAISIYLAYAVPELVNRMMLAEPVSFPLTPDLSVFAYLAGVTLVAGCLAGLAPAMESLKLDLTASLKGLESWLGSGKGKWKARNLLVGSQVAMSLVLLVGAGLFVRAQFTLFTREPGFETRHVLLVPLSVRVPPYTEDSAWSFYRTFEQRVRALPGVQSVCYATLPPFQDLRSEEVRLPGEVEGTGRPASMNIVSADFFETLKIPILRGRVFRQSDVTPSKSASVIIVSEALARTFWPGKDPLGKVIEVEKGARLEVVGVARDTSSERYGLLDGPRLYRLQGRQSFGGPLMARFEGAARPIQRAVRRIVRDMDGELMAAPRTLQSVIDDGSSTFWRMAQLVLLLGCVAVLLAVVGIYGVVSFAVSQRTREFGIRMALGATKTDIVRSVLRSGVRPIVAGLAVGLVLALAASGALAQVVKDTQMALNTRDPITYIAVLLLLILAALAAMVRPALRAADSDAAQALRND